MHISYWPPSWPSRQSLNEDSPAVCVQPVAWPSGQHSRTFSHINRGSSHWIELMRPNIDLLHAVLERNRVWYACCELCANKHCWFHCGSKNHYNRVYEHATDCPLDWEQSRTVFIQQFQVADCIVRFNHLDGSIDALSVHSSIPAPPLRPLEQPPTPSHPPPTGSRAPLRPLEQPPPPSYPPPNGSSASLAPLEQPPPPPSYPPPNVSSAPLAPLEQPPPPYYPPPTASSEEPLAVPVSPASQLLLDGLRRATGAAPLPAHATTGSRQTTPSPSPQFEPPQRSVLWHLQIVVDDDNSKLERAIQHLRDEAAAAQAGGVGVMLDLRLEQLESQVPVVRPSQSAPASSESSLSSADIERRWRDIEGRESFP